MSPDFQTKAATALLSSTTVEALADAFREAVEPLGMTASASGMVSGPRALSHQPFHFMNWPADWIALYQARGFLVKDPIPRWAIVSGEAVAWTEMMTSTPPDSAGREVWAAAARFGFHEGFVTPVRTRDGHLGLVSVGGGERPAFGQAERMTLQGLSAIALNRAEAILGAAPDDRSQAAFSLRERECHALLQQGFTDLEIARVLGISGETVRFHLNNARRKVGARNRVHLAALQLRSGE